MKKTSGTAGYNEATVQFVKATLAVDFTTLHKDFVSFLPAKPCNVFDIGAGIGRDAFTFSEMGHSVIAIEPVEAFRLAAKKMHDSRKIEWINDALPDLSSLDGYFGRFDFILASAIWHHLDHHEQKLSLQRVTELLNCNGVFALTLRNGPAGIGKRIFSTNGEQTVKDAKHFGLTPLLFLKDQPSLMKNKENVSWAKLVFQKTGNEKGNR